MNEHMFVNVLFYYTCECQYMEFVRKYFNIVIQILQPFYFYVF